MQERDNSETERRPAIGGLLRILWMWALPATVLCLLLIVARRPWTLGALDVALALVVLAGSAARVVDVEWCGGETAEGDPATRTDAIRYASLLVGSSIVGWLVAQSVEL
ncbi:MAG TPA: hypothetical protein VG755_34670 [Nannocystaceae bacterium]|nr:hypothetical protein [Nannocystaceae bacterium]